MSYAEGLNLRWYAIFGYLLLFLTITLHALSLAILCICQRRVSGFRCRQLQIIFISSLIQFTLRLVYDICYYSPLSEYNMLCWVLRTVTEVATCCTWLRIVILAGYYYNILKQKRDGDEKCALSVCLAAWIIPVFPIIFHAISISSSEFYTSDSCWRGPTNDILNITTAVDHLCLLAATMAFLVGCCHYLWYKNSESLLNQVFHFVPNIRGKINLVILYTIATIGCEALVEVRNFVKDSHDVLDVAAWCANGFMLSLCFCFLDAEIQKAFLSKGNHFLGTSDNEGSEINLANADILSSPPTTPSSLGHDDLNGHFFQNQNGGTLALKPWEGVKDDNKA